MFSPLYYLVVGLFVTALQLSWKRRIYCFSFFSLLLLSPDIRFSLGIQPQNYYIISSITFLFWVFLLERNRFRLFLFSVGVIIASYYPNIKFVQIGSAEIIIFGMMWHTHLDEGVKKLTLKIERKLNCVSFIKKLEIPYHPLPMYRDRRAVLAKRKHGRKDRKSNRTDKQFERIERKLENHPE